MTATFIFLMVVLKIPIAGLLYIVWWAVRQTPEPAGEHDGGAPAGGPQRPRGPRAPRPRRGPHAGPAPGAPPRVRPVAARGRERAR